MLVLDNFLGLRMVAYKFDKNFFKSNNFEKFVGNNANYYSKEFLIIEPLINEIDTLKKSPTYTNLSWIEKAKHKKMRELNKTIQNLAGFNWMGGLFSGLWMAYRKMYIEAAAVLFYEFLIFDVIYRDNNFMIFLNFVLISWIAGKFSNLLYYRALKRKLTTILSENELINKGRTNFLYAFIALLISILPGLIISDMNKIDLNTYYKENVQVPAAAADCPAADVDCK
jgi:hypothetical protein